MWTASRFIVITGLFVASLGYALPAQAAYADPPGRVARISDVRGDVGYSPAGEDVWLDVVRNRPLIRGDRVWTERNARVEMQVGSAAIRLGSDTSFQFLDLDDDFAQLELTQGTLNLRVRRLFRGESIEVATPTLAFAIHRAGRYRIDVDPRSDRTTIVVWEGAGTAYGRDDDFDVRAGESVRFYGADLGDYEMFGLPRSDAFDRYCFDRDQRLDRSVSLRYVDDDLIGYADLDDYGSWRSTRGHGMAWYPTQVAADWAPYRDGHWVWQEPFGWTWVDNAPWGFAPSHYGRWVHDGRWCWVPGPRNVRPIYAPALVAFVGGRNWSLSIGAQSRSPVGWFPLGPREVYVPSYRASRDYFTRVNINNTVINNTTIINVYNNYAANGPGPTSMRYANRNVPGAFTAVPGDVFANSRPVRGAALRLDERAIMGGEVGRMAPIAPSIRSVLGAGATSDVRPVREALARQVIARTPPPPEAQPFAARERLLQRNPGRPMDQTTQPMSGQRDAGMRQDVRVVPEARTRTDVRSERPSRNDVQPMPGSDRRSTAPTTDVYTAPDATRTRPDRQRMLDDARAQQVQREAATREQRTEAAPPIAPQTYERTTRPERTAPMERSQTMERSEPMERVERIERPERFERSAPMERAERYEPPQPMERSAPMERVERIERPERIERSAPMERVERIERPERIERAERVERFEPTERVERMERPERVERVERTERSEPEVQKSAEEEDDNNDATRPRGERAPR